MEVFLNSFTTPLLLSGIVFIIVSLLLMKFPPKEMNSFYGYRSSKSIESQEKWDFAQIYSARLMLKCGIVMVIVSFIGLFLQDLDPAILSLTSIGFLVIPIIILFYKTEQAIKNKFK